MGSFLYQSKTVISAVATVDFTLTSGLAYHAFVLQDVVPATDSVDLWARISQSATWKSGASDYAWSNYTWKTTANLASSSAAAQMQLNYTAAGWKHGTGTGEHRNGIVYIMNPGGGTGNPTIQWQMSGRSDDGFTPTEVGHGVFVTNTSAIDAIRFMFSSGNLASGTIYYYGIDDA